MKRLTHLLISSGVTLFSLALLARAGDDAGPAQRHFAFVYQVHVPALEPGSAAMRVWIPVPQSDAYQQVTALKIESPITFRYESEKEYGNRFAVIEVTPERAKAAFEVTLSFTATREEHRVALDSPKLTTATLVRPEEQKRFLAPDRLVPINGTIAELARQATAGAVTPLEKARRIYDFVVGMMRYDKSGEGWGRGDAIWACTSKRGNCTDFHSVLIGMMRASGIPARFEIGFPLPAAQKSGDIPGYHCWAEFYLEGTGWVPVDASEAWKNAEKRDYFFGAHDDNRVQFTVGRDLKLDHEQRGEPLNYFIYPYAEQGGRPFDKLQTHFSFHDIQSTTAGN